MIAPRRIGTPEVPLVCSLNGSTVIPRDAPPPLVKPGIDKPGTGKRPVPGTVVFRPGASAAGGGGKSSGVARVRGIEKLGSELAPVAGGEEAEGPVGGISDGGLVEGLVAAGGGEWRFCEGPGGW